MLPGAMPLPPLNSVSLQLLRGCASADYFINHSISSGSVGPYSTGVRHWFQFAPLIGTDPLMNSIPVEWTSIQLPSLAVKYSWSETCVMSFLSWLISEGPCVCPSTACGYLSAVRFFWVTRNVDVSFLEWSAGIRATKAGMKRVWNDVNILREADKSYLPVSADMILGFRASWSECVLPLRKLAVYTAMLFGYTTLSRVSEYLINSPGSDRYDLLSSDVSFVVVVDGVEEVVPSWKASFLSLPSITGCHIIIRKAKNDQFGKGHKYVFPRRVVNGVSRMYDFTTVLWEFSIRAKPVAGRSFFYIPVENWTLCPSYLNDQLKDLANLFRFDPSRVSSHSLRVGGASALAAAGVPEYVIKEMGGWRSLAFLAYLRATIQTFSDAQDVLTSASFLSAEKIRSCHPSFT